MRLLLLLALCLTAHPFPTPAQCPLVTDINTTRTPFDGDPTTGRIGEGGTFAGDMLRCGSHWYFVASTTSTGAELWRTDGTGAGTVLVKDINPGVEGSDPFYLTCCNSRVFFQASTPAHGVELWVSDGTAAGTVLVKDIFPGTGKSNPNNLCCLGTAILFSATDGGSGFELWISDGTAAGTRMLKDIRSGPLSSTPRSMKRSLLGRVYFQANDGVTGDELWITDGTTAGTMLLKDIDPGSGGSRPSYFVDSPGNPLETLFYADDGATGAELWKTDGTAGGTVLVKDINPGTPGSGPDLYHSPDSRLGGSIYFGADDGKTGYELWKTDGTAAGTVLVQDIEPGPSGSDPAAFRSTGTTLFLRACTANEGCELFALTGTTVYLVADIQGGAAHSEPTGIQDLGNGRVVFAADTGAAASGIEPFVSDGTRRGTVLLKDLFPGAPGSRPKSFTWTGTGTAVMFFAEDRSSSGSGRELYLTDGTAAGTGILKDLDPGGRSNPSNPNRLTASGGAALYYSADDGRNGRELWRTDTAGSMLVKDIRPGSEGSDPTEYVDLFDGSRNLTLFRADDGSHGSELWVTDGTAAGTTMLLDIDKGAGSSMPNQLARLGRRVFFSARTATTGYELWVTDGTAAGTVMVKDIEPGSGSSTPHGFTVFKGLLYFVAIQRTTTGLELWQTNGTPSGTSMVKDIRPGALGSSPLYMTPFGDVLLFRANDGQNGVELWRTDGTANGTVMVKNIAPGSFGGHPTSLIRFGNAVYFAASDNTTGTELWRTDGTANGTVLEKDIWTGPGSSRPGQFTISQGMLFFSADDGSSGTELFVTDGTPAGTRRVVDLRSGPQGSSPTFLVAAGDGVFFGADDGVTGREVYFSDGSAPGTRQVCDLNPGPGSATPVGLTVCDGRLYFVADDGAHGFELFRVGSDPATVERFGIGCGAHRPGLDATQPVLGKTCTFQGTGPAGGARLLIVGLPALPIRIPGLVASDCAIHGDLASALLLALPPGARWSMNVPVPNQPMLIGAQLVLQSAFDPLPLSLSRAVQITAGR